MKLTGKYRLTLTGETDKFVARHSASGLHYLLDRLFSGQEIAEEELRTWGLVLEETGPAGDAADLRAVTEDDVALALGEGCFVELPLTTPAEVLEAWNCLLDARLGREE